MSTGRRISPSFRVTITVISSGNLRKRQSALRLYRIFRLMILRKFTELIREKLMSYPTALPKYSHLLLGTKLNLQEENFPEEDITSFLSATILLERISGLSSGLMIFSEGKPARSMCCFLRGSGYILRRKLIRHWRPRHTAVTY